MLAKKYDVSTYQLERWLEDGELTATIQEYRNRETKFIREEELLKLVHRLDRGKCTLYILSKV